jgi:hypothetical protein
MKLTHAIAVLKHAQTLESVGTLSSAMKAQVENYEKNIVALKAACKTVTLTARRVRELAKVAEAVYAPGTFKDVDAKKIPTRKPAKSATPAKQQSTVASVGVTG